MKLNRNYIGRIIDECIREAAADSTLFTKAATKAAPIVQTKLTGKQPTKLATPAQRPSTPDPVKPLGTTPDAQDVFTQAAEEDKTRIDTDSARNTYNNLVDLTKKDPTIGSNPAVIATLDVVNNKTKNDPGQVVDEFTASVKKIPQELTKDIQAITPLGAAIKMKS